MIANADYVHTITLWEPNIHLPIVIFIIMAVVAHDFHTAVGNLVSHKRPTPPDRLQSPTRLQSLISILYLKIMNCVPICGQGRGLLRSRLMDYKYAKNSEPWNRSGIPKVLYFKWHYVSLPWRDYQLRAVNPSDCCLALFHVITFLRLHSYTTPNGAMSMREELRRIRI